jgi:acetoin utilization protein AcuB
MIAKELISAEIPSLKLKSTISEALLLMDDHHLRHLPLVSKNHIVTIVSESDLLDLDPNSNFTNYRHSYAIPSVHDKNHIYDIMRIMNDNNLTVIPVIDAESKYMGVVALNDLLKYFAETASFSETGSIIVLEIDKNNYSLSQIARIVESENASILNSFITSNRDSNQIELTIKINRQEISAILSTFVRFDYTIKASFTESDFIEQLKENYDSLMHYLKV